MPAPGSRLQQRFLPTARGEILVTAWLPAGPQPQKWLLIVPPFAEEMNKSRRMLAMLGRRVAAAGYGAALVDLGGTGDSWGDFRDARYENWCADLLCTADWVQGQGGTVTAALGLRFGGLLAAELAGRLPTVAQLLLWQPALTGADVLTQFLRLRTAAALTGGGDARETLAVLRARLAGGEPVEVAGYELVSELYTSIQGRQLADLVPGRALAVDWFHVSRQPAAAVPEPIAAGAGRLATAGATVNTHVVQGDAFWSTVEIAVCEELVGLTAERLAH